MPIRFYCDVCHQLLKITRRKSGAWIQCPNCKSEQLVPIRSTIHSKRHRHKSHADFSTTPPVWGEEVLPPPIWDEANSENTFSPIDVLTTPDREMVLPPVMDEYSSEFTTDSDFIEAEIVDMHRHDHKMVCLASPLVPRSPRHPMSTLAVVGLASAIIFFALGVLFGVYLVAPDHLHLSQSPSQSQPTSEDIYIYGTLTYLDANGVLRMDSGSNVFFLPVSGFHEPVQPLGLKIKDPAPSLAHPNLRHLIEQGGDFVRTDSQGDFSRMMQRSGRYHVLMVSAHTTRVADSPLDEVSQAVLKKYFTDPQSLIGQAKYILVEMNIQRGTAPLMHDFGANEKGIDEIFN